MKKCSLLILLMLVLGACAAQGEPVGVSGEIPGFDEEKSREENLHEEAVSGGDSAPGGDFYPMGSGGYAWLHGGEILAVQDGATIRYIDLDNRVRGEVSIPEEQRCGDFQLKLMDNRILVANGYDSSSSSGEMSVVLAGGEWVLANAAIYDEQGILLRAFPRFVPLEEQPSREVYGVLSDGREVIRGEDISVPEPHWVNEDLLALNARGRLFLYSISTDTLTLVDDIGERMLLLGIEQEYYDLACIMPYGEGFYYFVHRNAETYNTAGSVWYADKSGVRELFDGREFSSFACSDEAMVLLDWSGKGEDGGYAETHVWLVRAGKDELLDLAELPGDYAYQRTIGKFITLLNANGNDFYIIGSHGGMEVLRPVLEGCHQFDLLGIRDDGASRQYLYAALLDGEYQYYIAGPSAGAVRRLATAPYLFQDEQYHAPMSHFVERDSADDPYGTTAVRVRPMDPLLSGGDIAPAI